MSNQSRREIGIVFCLVLGLLIGSFIKRVTIGLVIGLALGLLTASLMSNRRK